MPAQRKGWAFGDRGVWSVGEHKGDLSRYLTILGSAHQAPKLYATEEEARAALARHPLANSKHLNMVVAHVTEVPHPGVTGRGYAYPITGAFDSENR